LTGERRLRATKLNNEKEILAIVLDKSDEESANLALVENLQREDLNAMEQALAMNYLMHYNNLTQAELANKLGYKQSTVANKLRLLKLPNYVKQALSLGTITERHARALLKVDESQLEDVFLTIVNRKYNVAKAEEYIKGLNQRKKEKGVSSNSLLAVNTIKEAYELCRKSGLDVDIRQTEYNDHIKIVLSIKK
jgi:ParB-like partition proteins